METFDFAFKGSRNYIQGGDLYNGIAKYLRGKYGDATSRTELSFHKLVSHTMFGEVLDTDTPTFPFRPPVICKFRVAEAGKILYLTETDRAITSRYEFDEESIIRPSEILPDGKSITVLNQTAYSAIEVIIALNKKLMQSIFVQETGKWLFTKLSLPKLLPEQSNSRFVVTFAGGHGYNLTRSIIAIEGERYGEIYFSMVRG